jgi:hypothetical protein
MVKRRVVEVHVAGLLRKHPDLEGLRWRSCALREAPLSALSGVIQDAWRRAFGDRIRIAYGPELLRYACACSREPGLVTLAEDSDGVCGAVIGLPLDWDCSPAGGASTLATGLSTTARWERGGLVEMLLAQHLFDILDAGHAFQWHWRATSLNSGGAAKPSLTYAKDIALYAKPLRAHTSARKGGMTWWQELGLHVLMARQPSGRRLPSGLTMTIFDPAQAGECAAFLNAHQPQNGIRRVFHPDTFASRCTFVEGGIRGAGWLFHDGRQLAGIAWGYVNPVSEREGYFALDGAMFHPELSAERRARCLSALEGHARGELGCFAIMAPASVCREPLNRLGYVPVRRYHVGAAACQDYPFLTRENVGNAFLELR